MKNFFVFNGNTSNGIGILQNDECSEPMFNKNCQEKWLNEQKYYDINYNNGTSLSIRFISFLSFFSLLIFHCGNGEVGRRYLLCLNVFLNEVLLQGSILQTEREGKRQREREQKNDRNRYRER